MKIKQTFPGKQKKKEFVSCGPALSKMLKEVH